MPDGGTTAGRDVFITCFIFFLVVTEILMTILQSMEGKYYDVPDDKAAAFEIPREKVKELLAKAGPPSPQGGPGGPGGLGGRRPSGPGPGQGGGSPVIIQVLPNGIHGPASSGPPPSAGEGEPAGAAEGDVDPYFWRWYNWTYGPYWGNRWLNW